MEPEANAVETQGTEPTQAETTSTEWNYDGQYKDVVAKKGWKSEDDVLKSYTELEKSMSSRAKIPADDALPEEKQKFWEKLGWPKDGYQVEIDENLTPLRNEGMESRILDVAHKNGLPQNAVNALVNEYYAAAAEAQQQEFESGVTQLQDELGDKYSEEVKIGQRFTQNCSEPFRELLERTGLGNHPVVVKEFIKLGKKTMSDSLIRGESINPDDKGWKPQFVNSPEMYRNADGPEGERARKWFIDRGHKY